MEDMKDRGLPITVVTQRESLAEQLSSTTWETVERPREWERSEEGVSKKSCVLSEDKFHPLQANPLSAPLQLSTHR